MPSHFPIGGERGAGVRSPARLLVCAALCLTAGTAGCPKKPVYVTIPKPVPINRASFAVPEPPDLHSEEQSDLSLAFVTPAEPTAPPSPMPHAAVPHRPAPDTNSTRPAPPQISPQISQADQAAYERHTNDSISEAQKNLGRAAGRQLSSSQQEMVEKIQGFITQAREALQSADYTRAQNLAQKAQLLSVELVNTL